MLTNIAINRMLETYKGLNKADILNVEKTSVGSRSIVWNEPNNKKVSVQPFFITTIGNNILNKLKLTGRTATGNSSFNLTAQVFEEDMRLIMTKNYGLGTNRVGFKAVYGGTTYSFLIFKCSDLTGITGIDTTDTTVYSGGETINKSLYDFLNDNYSQGIDERYINFKVNTGSGLVNFLTIPTTNQTYEVNEDSFLQYDLSKYTTGDINTTESTNSYFENLTEGIEML